jgi:hypothetical protein
MLLTLLLIVSVCEPAGGSSPRYFDPVELSRHDPAFVSGESQSKKLSTPSDVLAAAHERYETNLEKARAEVQRTISEKAATTREKLSFQDAFDAGKLPEDPLFNSAAQLLDDAVRELMRSYDQAAGIALAKEGGRSLAEELLKEQESWARIAEWAGWQDLADAGATLIPMSETVTNLRVDEWKAGTRLEMNLRLRGKGAVRLQVPCGDGAVREIDLNIKGKSCRIVMTYDDRRNISFDVGFDRNRPSVLVEAELDGQLALLDPSNRIESMRCRVKPVMFVTTRAADLAGSTNVGRTGVAGEALAVQWPAGTKLVGIRTRKDSTPVVSPGHVLSNDGMRIRIELFAVSRWIYVLERSRQGDNKFRVVALEKVERKSNNMRMLDSELVIEDHALIGTYKWTVNESAVVEGEFELRAFGAFVAQGGRKKDEAGLAGHEAWSAGSLVEGTRGQCVIEGQVFAADGRILRLILHEKRAFAEVDATEFFMYQFERVADGKAQEIRYRITSMTPLNSGPPKGYRSALKGELRLKGAVLEGEISFNDSRSAPREKRESLVLAVTRTEVLL